MFWQIFIIAAVLIGIGVFGMCFNIIFRKDGHFPEYEVSSNREMRKLGIRCMKEEEDIIFGRGGAPRHDHCDGQYTEACAGCALYGSHQGSN